MRAARLYPLFLTLQRNAEWWSAQPLLVGRPARHVRGLRARLAVRARPGHPAPPARQLRQAQRVREGQQAQQRAQHGAARRADVGRRAARRRARVGVLLHVRRRQAAVGQRPRAGHRPAGDRALRGQARPDAGAAAEHPEGPEAVRAGAADRRARPDRGRDRRALRAVLVLAQPAHPQRLRPVARRPLRRRDADRRRPRAAAVRRTASWPRAARCRRSTPAPGRSTRAARSRASPT